MPKVNLFGPPCLLSRSDETVLPVNRASWLPLYLAYVGDWVSREKLAYFFRPKASSTTAQRYLRKLLYESNQAGWVENLEIEPQRLRWRVRTDTHRFLQAFRNKKWAEAVQLYKGDFLQGFETSGPRSLREWVTDEREFLEQAWVEASLHYAEDLEKSGHFKQAVDLAGKVLAKDGLLEELVQVYMRTLYARGRGEAALRAYEKFRDELQRDLGTEPSESTQAIEKAIRSHRNPPTPHHLTYKRRKSDQSPDASGETTGALIAMLTEPNTRLLALADPGGFGTEAFVIAKRVPDTDASLNAIVELARQLVEQNHHERAFELIILVLKHSHCDDVVKAKIHELLPRSNLSARLLEQARELC